MKKLAIALGAFVFLIIAAMIIIPLVVDVDKYRPQIVAAANDNLNGKLELGHLKLSLWGHVRIEADGLTVKDAHGATVLGVKDASFYLPFLPLISGSPSIDLHLEQPTVNIIKNRAGKLNITSLSKSAAISEITVPSTAQLTPQTAPQGAPQTSAPQAVAKKPAPSEEQSVAVPVIAARARIGFELVNALVTYKDELSGMTTEMKDLNVMAKDLSLSHASEISLWSDFDTRLGKDEKATTVKGPARIDVQFSPRISGGRLAHFTVKGNADFDSLEITVPGSFEKKKGIPANIGLSVSGTDNDVKIEHADAHFFNAEIRSDGEVSNLQTTPTVHYNVKSNDIELKSWTELMPSLKEYELGGKANLTAQVEGPTQKLAYNAKFVLTALTAKAGKLKAQPRIDGSVTVATDQIQDISLTMKAPGNDLQVHGKMLSFTAPQLSLDIVSPEMDLDQLIDFQAPPAKADASLISSAYAAPEKAPADLDASLDPLRQNKMLEKMTANVGFNFKMLKAQNVRITDMTGRLYLKDLAAGIDKLNMKLFNGTIVANLASQLRPKAPTYKFSAKVIGLDLGEAVKSQVAMFKNTMTGKGNFDINGEGASFNSEAAKSNLRAKGALKIANAQFTSIDVGKMVTEALNNSISKIAGKIPALNGKKINGLPNGSSKYDLISSDFGISGGVFTAPNFVAKAVPNQGIDLKGTTTVGLKDQSIKAGWTVIDTYNLTRAKDLNVNIAGSDVPHILAEGNKPVSFPVNVGCTLQAPCYSYTEVPEYLGRVAMSNMTGAAQNRVKSELGNQIQKALGGGGGKSPDIGGALKGLFGH